MSCVITGTCAGRRESRAGRQTRGGNRRGRGQMRLQGCSLKTGRARLRLLWKTLLTASAAGH